MEYKVFYSWQSDLPNSTNRGFIEQALRDAANVVAKDDTIEVEPVLDRDTAGVAGSPEISATIFSKIEACQAFVVDVSIITAGTDARPSPNPNVLLELGFAAKALGWSRVVMVFNTKYGRIEDLPFDLRMRRVIPYFAEEGEVSRSAERKRLGAVLESAIRGIIAERPIEFGQAVAFTAPAVLAKEAVASESPRQVVEVRKFAQWLMSQLVGLDPRGQSGEADDNLIDAIAATVPVVQAFASVAEEIAVMNSREPALELHRGFEKILEHYQPPPNYSGSYSEGDFDLYRFIGHELYVTFMSFLIREGRWALINELLSEEFFVEALADKRSGGLLAFTSLSVFVRLLGYRKERLKLNRMSIHADILHERHGGGELAVVVPDIEFMSADFFLFLRGEMGRSKADRSMGWRPWSVLYLKQPPRFLLQARSKNAAANVALGLGSSEIDEVRRVLVERAPQLADLFRGGFWDYPLDGYDPSTLGSA